MNKITSECSNQLSSILSFLPEEMKRKIPQSVLDKIESNKDGSSSNINEIKDINQKNLLDETKKYLSFIYLNYLADETEKEEYIKILKLNEHNYQKSLQEKYSVDNIFNQNKKNLETEVKKEELPIEINQSLIKRILNKLKEIFWKK